MIPRCSLSLALLVGFGLALPAMADIGGPSRSIFPGYSSSLFPAPPAQTHTIAGATAPVWPSARSTRDKLEKGALAVGDFATSAPVGSALEALEEASLKDAADLRRAHKEASKAGAEGLRALERRLAGSTDPKIRGALDETRRKIQAELDDLDKGAAKATAQGSFLGKMGEALEILDLLSVGAQVAGYLVEGDTTGAAGVVANELAKKAVEGTGAFATSWAPGGPVYGSWAGNQAYETYIKPEIDAREQALREENLRRAVLNKPWLSEQSFLDGEGQVRKLEPDQYVERGTGLIRRRSPEDQAGYERVEFVKWRNGQVMGQILADHAAGKISDRQLLALQTSYSQRGFAEPWKPAGYEMLADDPTQMEPDASPSDDQETEDEAAPDQPATPPDAASALAAVPLVKLTASGSYSESFDGFADIITTLEVAFWNLGALSPGHEQAVLRITSSAEGSMAIVGTFSGGPNGTLSFADGEGGTVRFQLRGGTYVIAELERLVDNGTALEPITLTMPLSDPKAFDVWPETLK